MLLFLAQQHFTSKYSTTVLRTSLLPSQMKLQCRLRKRGDSLAFDGYYLTTKAIITLTAILNNYSRLFKLIIIVFTVYVNMVVSKLPTTFHGTSNYVYSENREIVAVRRTDQRGWLGGTCDMGLRFQGAN